MRPLGHSLTCLLLGCSFSPGFVGDGDGAVFDGPSGPDGSGDSVIADAGIDVPCEWGFTPEGGYASCRTDYQDLPTLDMAGTYTLDVMTGLFTRPDASSITLTLATAYDGAAALLPVQSLDIDPQATLRLVGARPVVIAVNSFAVIEGAVDASGKLEVDGPGVIECADGEGTPGTPATGNGAGGGGGGGFGDAGGEGGDGESGDNQGGAGGMAEGDMNFVLRAGCRGAAGGAPPVAGDGTPGLGGGAGGALQIDARTQIWINGGEVRANGGGGRAGVGQELPDGTTSGLDGDPESGGGGGGSGGGIIVQATTVTITRDPARSNKEGILCANGGSGGEGSHGGDTPFEGLDGLCSRDAADTPNGAGNTGDGGTGGYVGATAGGLGGNGNGGGQSGAGGGGGGSVGRIRIRSLNGEPPDLTTSSPLPHTAM